jgi:hypothetical protein
LESAREQGVSQPHTTVRLDPLKEPVEISLECGHPPTEGEHLWRYFWDLNQTRTSNGFEAARLSLTEIEVWERREFLLDQMDPADRARARLKPYELQAIKAMDRVFLDTQRDLSKKGKK